MIKILLQAFGINIFWFQDANSYASSILSPELAIEPQFHFLLKIMVLLFDFRSFEFGPQNFAIIVLLTNFCPSVFL